MKRMFFPFLITIVFLIIFRAFISNPETAVKKYFKEYGYELCDKPVEITDYTFPSFMSPVLEEYEKIQQKTGLSVKPYLGKTVKRYTYELKNVPPFNGQKIRANALVYKNKVICSDIMTVGLNGFMIAPNENLP